MNPWIDVAGWTLVHFVWEGAVIAATAFVLLSLLRNHSPQTRYAVACVALVVMVAAPLITLAALSPSRAATESAAALQVPLPPGPGDDAIPDALSILGNLTMARGLSSAELAPAQARVWIPVVVLIWIAGVGVLLLRLFGGWWRIHRLHRASRAARPSVWTAATLRIAATLGLGRRMHVVDVAVVDTPTVIGWLKPVILLPVGAFAGLSASQVDAILAHEVAHIRRHDFLVNLLQTFAETLLFYHPAIWWLSSRIRTEREHCCDLVALSVCRDAVSYAEALVQLESRRSVQLRLAMAATGGTLMVRVRRLLGAPADDRPRASALLIAGVVTLAICLAGASRYLVAAQPNGASASTPQPGTANDQAAWSMVFDHGDSTMRFIGYRGRDLIRFAHQIPAARVVGGPQWLDEQVLNIVVNLSSVPRADEMPGIVRAALESRLQLKTHIETRNFPALALVMAREDRALGPRLRAASRPCFDAQKWIAEGQPPDQLPERRGVPACGGEIESPLGWTQYASITMPEFADQLRDYIRGWPVTPREPPPAHLGPALIEVRAPDIVDRTGLSGRYDVEFSAFYPTAALMSRFPILRHVFEPMGFSSVPRALADQLGLALVESEAPYDVIVIDQAERP